MYTTAATREQEEEGTSLRVGARKEAPMARAGSISLVQQRQVLLRRWLWKTATPPTSKQVKFLQKVLLLVAEGLLQKRWLCVLEEESNAVGVLVGVWQPWPS